jgi:hypothetical protein
MFYAIFTIFEPIAHYPLSIFYPVWSVYLKNHTVIIRKWTPCHSTFKIKLNYFNLLKQFVIENVLPQEFMWKMIVFIKSFLTSPLICYMQIQFLQFAFWMRYWKYIWFRLIHQILINFSKFLQVFSLFLEFESKKIDSFLQFMFVFRKNSKNYFRHQRHWSLGVTTNVSF